MTVDDLRDRFDEIYRRNEWNGRESLSGPGSGTKATRAVRAIVRDLVDELDCESVVNLGCGDDYWTPDLPGYVGVDVASAAIARARSRHPERSYLVGDVRALCPPGDLVVLRDVIQHLPLADGRAILETIRGSGSKWLLASTYLDSSTRHPAPVNVDVPIGGYYCPDLVAPPFSLLGPRRLYPDGFGYDVDDVVRDPSKYLGLWKIDEL